MSWRLNVWPPDFPVIEGPRDNLIGHNWDNPRPEQFERRSYEDLGQVKLEQANLIFASGPFYANEARHEQGFEEYHEFHFNELFINIQTLAGECFGGRTHHRAFLRRSMWAHEYPGEFYDYVQTVAHPDPHTQQWEHLLRSPDERIMLVSGIIWKVLHGSVLSSLLFGAGFSHENVLSAHDQEHEDIEGFSLSSFIANTNGAYLRRYDGVPPYFWIRVERVTAQIVKMLLPLYNICGNEFTEVPASFEDFAQATFDIVAYAGWINLLTRQSTGVLNIIWPGPGFSAQKDEKWILKQTWERSEARAESHDRRSSEDGIVSREKKVKICAAPAIARLSLDSMRPGHHRVHVIQEPHVVYYHGRKDEDDFMSLTEYRVLVSRAGELPPAWVVLMFAGIVMAAIMYVSGY